MVNSPGPNSEQNYVALGIRLAISIFLKYFKLKLDHLYYPTPLLSLGNFFYILRKLLIFASFRLDDIKEGLVVQCHTVLFPNRVKHPVSLQQEFKI